MKDVKPETLKDFEASFKFQLGDTVRLKTDGRHVPRFTVIGRHWWQRSNDLQKLYRVAFAASSGAVAVQDVAECALEHVESLRGEKMPKAGVATTAEAKRVSHDPRK